MFDGECDVRPFLPSLQLELSAPCNAWILELIACHNFTKQHDINDFERVRQELLSNLDTRKTATLKIIFEGETSLFRVWPIQLSFSRLPVTSLSARRSSNGSRSMLA